jgi:RNA polymerase sigma-70 factor (ECF subfamily)
VVTDEALYREARAGSERAFAALYERYEGPLFGFLLRRCGNRQDAEDVFQEAMLAVIRGPGARFEAGGFAAWLYRVALNGMLNRGRARERRERREHAAGGADVVAAPAGEVAADEALVERERQAGVEAAAARLSGPLAEVYALRRDGRSYEEMAARLGVPLGTVKSRMSQLVATLRREMARWGVK